MKAFLIIVTTTIGVLFITSGCTTTSTNANYMASPSYQLRELASSTLFKGDEAVLSGETIEEILNAKIELPSGAKLAVMSLNHYGNQGLWSPEAAQDEKTIKNEFLHTLKQTKRLEDVSILPSLLTPEKRGVPQLREAAARYQAHLLLVYQTYYNTFGKYRMFGKDEVKAYCVVEAALIDIRTGIVPFTSVSLQEFQIEKSKEDLNLHESSMKAKARAEGMALQDIAINVSGFLDAFP